jgi:hypothetical protein
MSFTRCCDLTPVGVRRLVAVGVEDMAGMSAEINVSVAQKCIDGQRI